MTSAGQTAFGSPLRWTCAATLIALLFASLAVAQQSPGRAKRSSSRDDSALLDLFAPPAARTAPDTPGNSNPAKLETPPTDHLRIDPAADVQSAAAGVGAAGFLTIDKAYRRGGLEASLRRRSLIPPRQRNRTGCPLIPIEIHTTVEADGSGALVLPCPRDVADQTHVATRVTVVSRRNGAEHAVRHRASIIYSESPDKRSDHYRNPFVYVDLNFPEATGPLEVRTLHWMLLPEYPPQRDYRDQVHHAAEAVQGAVDRAAAIEYDIEIQIHEAPNDPQRGDCSVKAYVARNFQPKLGHQRIEVVEGYRYRLPAIDEETGGCHFQNLVIGPQDLFMFDATGRSSYFVGPPVGFITTSVGGEFSLPAMGDPPGKVHQGSNLGFYSGFKSHAQARLSTPTFGERAETLAELANGPPGSVARYALVLWRERTKLYAPQ